MAFIYTTTIRCSVNYVSNSVGRTNRAACSFCKKNYLQGNTLKQFFTKEEPQRKRAKLLICLDNSIVNVDSSVKEALNTFVSQSRKSNTPSYIRITAADFAVASGVSVDKATQQLLHIASEVEGALDVSEQGEILYRIPVNYETILQRKSLMNSLQKMWQPVWSALFYLLRISFGIFLLISLLIVFAAILFVNNLSSRQSEDNRSSSFHSPRFYIGPSISDIFYFFRGPSYYRYYGLDNNLDNSSRREQENNAQQGRPKGFLEAAYSFLFGDGDPNADFEKRKWKAVAAVIRANDCVVTAEQLAPYLMSDNNISSDENSILVDESFMIPALVRFGGIPQVLENGEIIYLFPELRKTAKNVEVIYTKLPPFPLEKEIPFSLASSTDLWMVALVAGLNLMGALTLGNMLSSPQVVLSLSRELGFSVGFLSAAFQGLLSYAVAFLLVPLARWLYIMRINRQRKSRNSRREKAFRLLQKMPEYLQNKLQAARKKALGLEYVGKDPIIYASDKDIVEQSSLP